jgi:hypothetical protein
MKRILAILLAAAAFTCYGTAQASKNAEEKAEQQAKKHEANVKITKGPTIEYASADKAVIAWSTNVPSSTVVRYGTDPNNLNQTAQAPYGGDTHRVHLNNLKADTNYFFTFESEHGQGTGSEAESSQTYGLRTTATNAQAIHEQPAVTAAQLQSGAAPTATVSAATPATVNQGQREPLYKLSSGSDRLYTTSTAEMTKAKSLGYNFEGVAGYVATSQIPGTQPLYRLVKSANGKNIHFYTANPTEMQSAQSQGFRLEGAIGYVPTTQMAGTVPLERLQQPGTGEYLYTTSTTEKNQAVSRYHYQDQGVACYIWQS